MDRNVDVNGHAPFSSSVDKFDSLTGSANMCSQDPLGISVRMIRWISDQTSFVNADSLDPPFHSFSHAKERSKGPNSNKISRTCDTTCLNQTRFMVDSCQTSQ